MGFFDEITKIVTGSIDLYQANEAFDKLIEESQGDYADCLTDDNERLYEEFVQVRDEYTEKRKELSREENDAFLKKAYGAKIAYLESLIRNDDFPESFRTKISEAIKNFNPAFAAIMDENE